MFQPRLVNVEPWEKFGGPPYANGSWFKKLKEDAYFRTVQILPDGSGIEWNSGQDIAPHELYECSVSAQ